MAIAPYQVGRAVAPRDSGSLIPPPGSVAGWGAPGPYVWDASTARSIPAVGRCVGLYGGMVKQMPMNVYRGADPLPRPRLLSRPDPNRGGPWFVQVSVEDYLLNGNAIAQVTARDVNGWPLAVTWWPASWVYISWTPPDPNNVAYYLLGYEVPNADIIHVRRGADRFYPVRGVGVVEEHMGSLNRVAAEEIFESSALSSGAVPSVAIITPQATLTQDVATEAKANWLTTYGGATREPAILPNGTVIQPLAWSPADTQLTEARRMSLTDVANMFNLDSYWLGAAVQGMTYKTAGPQYQQILRTSLEPVLADFEDVWSDAWLPRGQSIHFDRNQLLRDDLPTTATAMATLVGAGIVSAAEARAYMDLPTAQGDPLAVVSVATPPDQGTGAIPPVAEGGPAQP
jgi:HK97 family phage portal protein